MKSLYEELGGTYRQVGDYFIPDIELPERNYEIGKYGRMRHRYLKEHRKIQYTTMILDGTLLDARLELRQGMDRSTVTRIQAAYETQYSPFTMAEARRDVSNMLDEHGEEPRSVRERLRKHQ